MIQNLGQQNTINSYVSVSKHAKFDVPVNTEKVEIFGWQTDSEMQKAGELRKMHEKSSLWDNFKEVVGGLACGGVSKIGTVSAVLGAAAAGGAAVAFGAGAIVAIGAGAVGFVVAGYTGVLIDFMKHPGIM